MTIGEKVRDMIRNWLRIKPGNEIPVTIQEPLRFETDVTKNKIWYRGEASELDQLYKQLASDSVSKTRFWAAAPESEQIRKIHSGLPGMMVNTLAYIVKADMSEVSFKGEGQSEWEEIAQELDFVELVGGATQDTLVSGDGAFKISMDTEVSDYPIVEFWPADRVTYTTRHGRITEIIFTSFYTVEKDEYRLEEVYSKGSIAYRLLDKDKEVPLTLVPELAGLQTITYDGNHLMAVPFRVYESTRFKGRGRSIYDGKTEVFDAHDEVVSQWMDALRSGRVKSYIPEDMLPRNPQNGALLPINSFGNAYITTSTPNRENAVAKIETVQPEIRYEAFISTYNTTLDMCLQGIMSPATLGIDIGKMSSADAQREKKDVTGFTRNAITSALEKVLPQLITTILETYDRMQDNAPGAYDPTVTFGEYSSPDFDSRVGTISKAATSSIMSTEAMVEELWGGSKDEKWIEAEIARIKQEKGIVGVEEPSVGDEIL